MHFVVKVDLLSKTSYELALLFCEAQIDFINKELSSNYLMSECINGVSSIIDRNNVHKTIVQMKDIQ